MNALRCSWQVTAGLLLGETDEHLSRAFGITSMEWGAPGVNRMLLILQKSHEAMAYATSLQVASASGCGPNWVRIEFIWM